MFTKALHLAIALFFLTPMVSAQQKQNESGKAFLGIAITDVPDQIKATLGAYGQGVRIQQVYIGSPAQLAGLKDGDIVISVDEQPVTGRQDLADKIAGYKSGNQPKITLIRIQKLEVYPILGRAPVSGNAAAPGQTTTSSNPKADDDLILD